MSLWKIFIDVWRNWPIYAELRGKIDQGFGFTPERYADPGFTHHVSQPFPQFTLSFFVIYL